MTMTMNKLSLAKKIDYIVKEREPSKQSLLELLKLVDPTIERKLLWKPAITKLLQTVADMSETLSKNVLPQSLWDSSTVESYLNECQQRIREEQSDKDEEMECDEEVEIPTPMNPQLHSTLPAVTTVAPAGPSPMPSDPENTDKLGNSSPRARRARQLALAIKIDGIVQVKKPSKYALWDLLKLIEGPSLLLHTIEENEAVRTSAMDKLFHACVIMNQALRHDEFVTNHKTLQVFMDECCETFVRGDVIDGDRNVIDVDAEEQPSVNSISIPRPRIVSTATKNAEYLQLAAQIDAIVMQSEPCKDSLYKLLKLVDPNFNKESMDTAQQRRNAALAKLADVVTTMTQTLSKEEFSSNHDSIRRFLDQCGPSIADEESAQNFDDADSLASSLAGTKRKANPNSPPTTSDVSMRKHIHDLTQQEPSAEVLYQILKKVFPTIQMSDVCKIEIRNAAMAAVVDKLGSSFQDTEHIRKYMARCSRFFQKDATSLMMSNESQPAVSRREQHHPPSTHPQPLRMQNVAIPFPQRFHVESKWPFLNVDSLYPSSLPNDLHSNEEVGALQCINARAAVAHGQPVETPIKVAARTTRYLTMATQIFQTHGGGVNWLDGRQDIQREIMQHGPVLSLSFASCDSNLPMANHPGAQMVRKHMLLIVGWEVEGFVWYWLVKYVGRFDGGIKPSRIAMGQFGIEKECIAPKSSFENTPWQRGPYFDIHQLPSGWMESPRLSLCVKPHEKDMLLLKYTQPLTPFLIRDEARIAHSRRYVIRSTHYIPESGLWCVKLTKVT